MLLISTGRCKGTTLSHAGIHPDERKSCCPGDEALRDLWLPRLRADLTVSARYQYVEKEPLECPIVVLSGNEDELSTEAGLNGWLTQTTAEVRYFRFAGNHFFLHSAEQLVLSRIAEELTKLIAHQPLGG